MTRTTGNNDRRDQQARLVYHHDEQWEDAVLTRGRTGPADHSPWFSSGRLYSLPPHPRCPPRSQYRLFSMQPSIITRSTLIESFPTFIFFIHAPGVWRVRESIRMACITFPPPPLISQYEYRSRVLYYEPTSLPACHLYPRLRYNGHRYNAHGEIEACLLAPGLILGT